MTLKTSVRSHSGIEAQRYKIYRVMNNFYFSFLVAAGKLSLSNDEEKMYEGIISTGVDTVLVLSENITDD